ncbi:MAG: hypothetical protein WCJ06_09080 [Planctomycetota bacterium]
MNNTAQSLRTVATGLGLVYGGLCLFVFSVSWPFLGGELFALMGPVGPGGVFFLLASTPVLMLLAILLDTIGRLLCLAMPADQSGTRPIIYVSLAFSLLPLAISALKIGNLFFVLVHLPQVMDQLQIPLALLGSVLFVIFLKNLAKYVQKPDLAGRANTVLILGVVTVVAALGMVVLVVATKRVEFAGMLLLGVPVLGIILLIMYGKLLTYLRKAVLQHVATESTAG